MFNSISFFKQLSRPVILGIAIGFLLAGYIVFAAFQPPTGDAPTANISAPLNVSFQGQEKLGGLVLNTGGAPIGLRVAQGNLIVDQGNLSVDQGNLIVDQGNVGIGISSPVEKLEVVGIIYSNDPFGGFKFPDGTIQTTAAGGGGFTTYIRTCALVGPGNPPSCIASCDPGDFVTGGGHSLGGTGSDRSYNDNPIEVGGLYGWECMKLSGGTCYAVCAQQ